MRPDSAMVIGYALGVLHCRAELAALAASLQADMDLLRRELEDCRVELDRLRQCDAGARAVRQPSAAID